MSRPKSAWNPCGAESCAATTGTREEEHKPEAHLFERDNSLPLWHGWHAFRRGLATNLHAMGIADKEIQGILRHSNVGLTMNVYVKTVSESQTAAMDTLSEKLGICTVLATSKRIQ
jgi:integrase